MSTILHEDILLVNVLMIRLSNYFNTAGLKCIKCKSHNMGFKSFSYQSNCEAFGFLAGGRIIIEEQNPIRIFHQKINLIILWISEDKHAFSVTQKENLESIPGDSGYTVEFPLNEVPTYCKDTHSHPIDNLEMSNDHPRTHLWTGGRKLEYPEETPRAWGNIGNSTHIVG